MKKRLALALVLVAVLVLWAVPVAATNPTVTITISAQVVSITNSEATWAIGQVVVDESKYFSADNSQDDNYSTITNTGNVAVDIEIQGTNFVASNVSLNWTLAAAAGNQTYSLYANSGNGSATYDTEVKNAAAYNDIVANLAVDSTYVWSMNLTVPSWFNPEDDGASKSATITLVASKHT